MKISSADVLIVGGGIVGCSAALFLSQRGIRTILLERDTCGSRSSGINFGGVRCQGRALDQLPLAMRAKTIWLRLPELLGTDGELMLTGHLKMARTSADMAALEKYAADVRDAGLHLELLNAGQLQQRCPWLASDLAGASLCPTDGQANPRLVSPAFAAAARQAGTDIIEHIKLTTLTKNRQHFELTDQQSHMYTAPILLNCAGAWSGQIASAFGDEIPVYHAFPAMAVTEPVPYFIPHCLGVQGGDIYCRQVTRGNIVFGGGRGTGLDDTRSISNAENLLPLLDRLIKLIPATRHLQILRTWTGIEGYLPDKKPVIGASTTMSGLYHGFGFSGGGFETGPGAGAVLADLIADGRTETPISIYSPQRFTQLAQAIA